MLTQMSQETRNTKKGLLHLIGCLYFTQILLKAHCISFLYLGKIETPNFLWLTRSSASTFRNWCRVGIKSWALNWFLVGFPINCRYSGCAFELEVSMKKMLVPNLYNKRKNKRYRFIFMVMKWHQTLCSTFPRILRFLRYVNTSFNVRKSSENMWFCNSLQVMEWLWYQNSLGLYAFWVWSIGEKVNAKCFLPQKVRWYDSQKFFRVFHFKTINSNIMLAFNYELFVKELCLSRLYLFTKRHSSKTEIESSITNCLLLFLSCKKLMPKNIWSLYNTYFER